MKKDKVIRVIIFDLGGVILPLYQSIMQSQFKCLNPDLHNEIIESFYMNECSDKFETGELSMHEYLQYIHENYFSMCEIPDICKAINSILGNVTKHTIQVLQQLRSYCAKLCLLSNTNPIHVEEFEKKLYLNFQITPKDLFDHVFYSYEMQCRKPNKEIYLSVLNTCACGPEQAFFIDDNRENITMANQLGIHSYLYPQNKPLDAASILKIIQNRFSFQQ